MYSDVSFIHPRLSISLHMNVADICGIFIVTPVPPPSCFLSQEEKGNHPHPLMAGHLPVVTCPG